MRIFLAIALHALLSVSVGFGQSGRSTDTDHSDVPRWEPLFEVGQVHWIVDTENNRSGSGDQVSSSIVRRSAMIQRITAVDESGTVIGLERYYPFGLGLGTDMPAAAGDQEVVAFEKVDGAWQLAAEYQNLPEATKNKQVADVVACWNDYELISQILADRPESSQVHLNDRQVSHVIQGLPDRSELFGLGHPRMVASLETGKPGLSDLHIAWAGPGTDPAKSNYVLSYKFTKEPFFVSSKGIIAEDVPDAFVFKREYKKGPVFLNGDIRTCLPPADSQAENFYTASGFPSLLDWLLSDPELAVRFSTRIGDCSPASVTALVDGFADAGAIRDRYLSLLALVSSPAEVEELGRWLTDTKTANRLETAFAAMSDRENIETFTRKINAGKSAYLARVSKAMAMVEDGGFFRVYLENRKNFLDGFDALLKRVCGLPAPEAEVMRQVEQSQAVSLFVLGNLYAFDGKPETEMDRYFAGLQSEAGKRFAALNDQVGRAAFLGWANSLAHKEKAARQQEPPPD